MATGKKTTAKKKVSTHAYRTKGTGRVGKVGNKRSVREGHTASGRKTGRSQYIIKEKTASKIKPRGVKKSSPTKRRAKKKK